MKATPLKRLAELARKDKGFFKLLHDDRKAALEQAAKEGIKLSLSETKILASLLTGRRVVLTVSHEDLLKALTGNARFPKFKPIHIDFWDIFCELVGYKRPVKRVSKSRAGAKSRKG